LPPALDAAIVARVKPLQMVRLIAFARAAFGAALALKTAEMLRLMVRNEEPGGSLFLFARVVGIRDLVLGAGTLAASFGDESDVRRWATTCLASDIADTVAGASASRYVGRGGAAAATVASLPFVAGGAWSLRGLSKP
jgi:hypothetical protein